MDNNNDNNKKINERLWVNIVQYTYTSNEG